MKSTNDQNEIQPSNILLKTNWASSIKLLSVKDRSDVLTNIFNYHTGEELVPLSKVAQLFFHNAVEVFDYNRKKYESQVAANRENGKKGGRRNEKHQNNPMGSFGIPNNPDGFFENPENPKDKARDIVKENDRDKEKYIDIDDDIERDIVTGRIKETDPRFEYYWMLKFDDLLEIKHDTVKDQEERRFVLYSNLFHKKLGRENFSKLIFQSKSEETSILIRTHMLDQSQIENIRFRMVYFLKKILK